MYVLNNLVEHEKTKFMFNLLREDKWVIRITITLFLIGTVIELWWIEVP